MGVLRPWNSNIGYISKLNGQNKLSLHADRNAGKKIEVISTILRWL